jgi:uncharacterized repeat protein (TIGR02543 family)
MKTMFEIFKVSSFLKMRTPHTVVFLFLLNLFCNLEVSAQSTKEYKTSTDTLVVYSDVPGLNLTLDKKKYSIRVRSAASNNQWVDVFAHYTYNRAKELGGVSVPMTDGNILNTTVYHYAKHTSDWSHTYGNIEMSENSPVEVEIALLNGFKVRNLDLLKATVHPAQKASAATISNGKIYFTINKPCQVVVDINGQMDDFNAAINGGIGMPVHAISFFANPVIKKPSLNNARVHYVEPGISPATLKEVNPASYDTLYFKPGVHDLGQDIKMYPGKVIYLPGDAFVYGNLNNKGVPAGTFSKNGENIRVYGYGTLSGAKIVHYLYVPSPNISTVGLDIDNGLNWRLSGITIVDPALFSVHTTGGVNGLISYVKAISWRANGDGIGGYEPALDCFIRTQDDGSYVKGYKARCTFWKDANAALFHMPNIPENQSAPLIIEDCDVLYLRHRFPIGTGGGFQQRGEGVAGQQNVNVIVRNIRIHDRLVNTAFFNLQSYDGTEAAPTKVGSSYKGILFQNISIAGMARDNKQRIFGCAAAPWYGGLIFDNLTIGGTKVTLANHLNYFTTNQFVKYLLFEMPKNVTLNTIADPVKGSITRDPDQITYLETSTVTLNAKGKTGYVFSHWSGDITGKVNPIEVVVDKNMTITANFTDPDFTKPISISAPGTGTFIIPAGVIGVTATIWGAGGAGGSASNGATAMQARGGGGAGGGFAKVTRTVTAGQLLSYNLGAGGIAAPVGFVNNTAVAVQRGGNSNVTLDTNIIALAQGGIGGINIAGSTSTAALIGAGGFSAKSGNIGDTVFYGGNGAAASSNGTGGGGGSAGSMGNGGNATAGSGSMGLAGAGGGANGGIGINSTNVGNPGNVPGAGGSGAAVRAVANNTMKGGDGSDGSLVFTFTLAPLSTNQADLEESVSVYPNPVSDKVYFTSKDKEISTVELTDLSGKVVYSSNVKQQSGNIDLSSIAKGVYLMIINIESNSITKKISVK